MIDKQPTRELLKEFWERCGFSWSPSPYRDERGYWVAPQGEALRALPQIDLNNLFEYAVPKAREEVGADELARRMAGWISDVVLVGINPEDSLFRLLDNIRSGGRG